MTLSPLDVHAGVSHGLDNAAPDAGLLERTAWAQLGPHDLEAIRSIVKNETLWRGIECVPEVYAGPVMDELQAGLDDIRSDDDESRQKYIKCLRRLSKKYGIVPSQLYIPRSCIEEYDEFRPGGAFSDVSMGRLRGVAPPVCLKRLRVYKDVDKVKKALCEEALLWRQLRHDNVLPFYGMIEDVTDYPSLCLISPWMEQGNINEFLENNPHHDRRGMCWDITAGLQYLHGLDPCIIHKDIRGANILVGPGPENRCFLTDFGLRIITETQMVGTTTRSGGSVRWLPLELIGAAELDSRFLCHVDIYALGCTFVEIYTGSPPYSDLETDSAVVSCIAQGMYPPQPCSQLLPPNLWQTVVMPCLAPSPKDRPSAKDILERFRTLYSTYLSQYLKGRGHPDPYLAVGFPPLLPRACLSFPSQITPTRGAIRNGTLPDTA
ncbi:kinase-like protein [Hymenopellis radicata]|nr:kinase-like protein [Hymenopellis radicata]